MKKIKGLGIVIAGLVAMGTLSACFESAADSASNNLSKAAENFEVPRRIIGVNGITDKVLWSVEGFCSYELPGNRVDVTCLVNRKTGEVTRTTMSLSDNVFMINTQMEGVSVDLFQPRIIFRPETVVPNFDMSTSARP